LNPAFRKRKREFTLVGDIAKNNYAKRRFFTRETCKFAIEEIRDCAATRNCALLAQLLPNWAMKITIWNSRDRKFNFRCDDFVSTLRITKPLYWATQYSRPLLVSAFSCSWRLAISRQTATAHGGLNLGNGWSSGGNFRTYHSS